MQAAIAYTRLSKPNKKGRPGIGLEAQQAALAAFAKAEGFDLIETFSETETGEGSDALEKRPQLAAAMKLAKKHKAPVIVAKLDRRMRLALSVTDRHLFVTIGGVTLDGTVERITLPP